MGNARDIRRRIRSIKNTAKMTRAMEMISAVKMRKAVEQVLHIRPYAHTAWSILTNLSRAFELYEHPLLVVRPVRKVLAIVVASNRGLCGSFNMQVFKKLLDQVENPENLMINRKGAKKIISPISVNECVLDIVSVGKKADAMARRLNKNSIASFPNISHVPDLSAIRPISKIAIDDYSSGKYDKVVIVYTDYVSAMLQQARVRQLIPISSVDLEKQIAEMDVLGQEFGLDIPVHEYKVEPDPETVLSMILPGLIQMQVYHAVLESSASQESARMVAMKNATESAKEIASDLTLAYNQIRQTKITQEIAEISAGRAVLE